MKFFSYASCWCLLHPVFHSLSRSSIMHSAWLKRRNTRMVAPLAHTMVHCVSISTSLRTLACRRLLYLRKLHRYKKNIGIFLNDPWADIFDILFLAWRSICSTVQLVLDVVQRKYTTIYASHILTNCIFTSYVRMFADILLVSCSVDVQDIWRIAVSKYRVSVALSSRTTVVIRHRVH